MLGLRARPARWASDADGAAGDARPSGCGAGGWCSGGDERRRRHRRCEPAAATTAAIDAALAALYDAPAAARASGPAAHAGEPAGWARSAPGVARWLGDIRSYFPSTVVQVMQRDAIERLDLPRLLLEPEMLAAVEPDIHLVGTLLSLNRVMPDETQATARPVVAKVVADLERRSRRRPRQAVTRRAEPGGPDQPAPPPRHRLEPHHPGEPAPLPARAPDDRARAAGRLRPAHRSRQRDVVLSVDQSGSMAASVVYSGVFAAVLASMRSLRTSLVVFDTAVVDLTDELHDPVEVLFGTQLGGGTDINALAYCRPLTRPRDSILVLISDLYEGGTPKRCCAGSPA